MPMGWVMGDMVLLPNGDVLIINGAGLGTVGWELGRDPVMALVAYCPDGVLRLRFKIQEKARIPRMYHSSAVLLRDGRVLVGASNLHELSSFTKVLFPNELSLEAFSPQYLDPTQLGLRPVVLDRKSSSTLKYGSLFRIKFSIARSLRPESIKITMIRLPFTTHSFSTSQRSHQYDAVNNHPDGLTVISNRGKDAQVYTHSSTRLLYVICGPSGDVPNEGIWVQLL
ncbi:LOW QUALITY PROTEIN: hypothetical protein Cgig2_005846 [Carnegiea gigantea]|uniref:Galactose oxidase-like Early set domain-containing protein n=1 Tax=Carnegiea gigantea TaxID=171969 RepID=A0A9Q1KMG2_9CARY|nr:LOW QUALITY PROTEIN: hypothetical protein Cgig2_005846 [Carnegiea gigantea]